MTKPFRFGSAVSAVVLASAIAGCAAPKVSYGLGVKSGDDTALATRALAALNSNDLPTAIDLAERAVAKTPDDAGYRALLGNAYFAAGRFQSAEAAFKDSLTIYSNQPHVVLKLALVQIALGKRDEAVAFLGSARAVLDPANYGLALALAGRAEDAIPVLEAAARQPGADARARQNLALAYAFTGDWTNARTIAAQDIPADQLDAHIQKWMQLAKPSKASDQVAALVGVTPARVDVGQPVQLALRKPDVQVAQAAPAVVPAPAPVAEVAEAAPVSAEPALPDSSVTVPLAQPKPVLAEAPIDSSAAMAVLTSAAREVSSAVENFVAKKPAAPKPKVHRAAARVRKGNSDAVMQLGSYRSPDQVMAGWARLTKRYPALREYLPMKARFDSAKGTFWRLSVQGFDSQREAMARCSQLKGNGGQCFVRGEAGDAPVQIASR